MLHLVHVLTSLEYGGIESFALRLLKRLPRDQFRSSIMITTPEQGKRYDDFVAEVNLPAFHCYYQHRRRVRFIRALSRQLKGIRPDIVLSYAYGTHAMVAIASWLAGVPRNYVRVAGEPVRHLKKSKLMTKLGRPFCHGEIAVSKATARQLVENIGLPANRVFTIENGCEVEEIQSRANRSADIPSDTLRLIMVSRMDDAKDHETLLQAVAKLNAQGKKVELQLAGEGPSRPSHEALARQLGIVDQVQFLGNCQNVPELLGQADFLVHSTRTEGMPNVLLEAMAAEIPIIASDIEPCRELLQNGVCGKLFVKGDVHSLIQTIVDLQSDQVLQKQLTSRAAQRVREQYHVDRMAQRYIHLFQHGTPD